MKSVSPGSTTALFVPPNERLGGYEMGSGAGFPSTKPCRAPSSSARPDSTNCFPGRPTSRPMHSCPITSDGIVLVSTKGISRRSPRRIKVAPRNNCRGNGRVWREAPRPAPVPLTSRRPTRARRKRPCRYRTPPRAARHHLRLALLARARRTAPRERPATSHVMTGPASKSSLRCNRGNPLRP